MKTGLKKALFYYKYILLLFILGYSIFIGIDDNQFFAKVGGVKELITLIGVALVWLLILILGLSFYYWISAVSVVFIYCKLRKSKQNG